MRVIINLVWQKFWMITVISFNHWWHESYRNCICNCGKKTIVMSWSLKGWYTKSCWCIRKNNTRKMFTTHWMTQTKIFTIFQWLKKRCTDKKSINYKDYWWRWIKNMWKSFEEFYANMWPTYKEWLTLDRIDNDGNYCKENCRWATNKEQANNRRNNHIIEYNWKIQTLQQWSEEIWVWCSTLYWRVKQWWDFKKVLSNIKYSRWWLKF